MKKILYALIAIPCIVYAQEKDAPAQQSTGKSDLYTKPAIEHLATTIRDSKSLGFELFYLHGAKVDSVMQKKGYAREVVDYVIAKEDIDPQLWDSNGRERNEKPDWNAMTSIITGKYNQAYAIRTVLNAKLRWYDSRKDTVNLLRYTIQKIDTYGLDTTGFGKMGLNNVAYYMIFMHSNDPATIQKGIQWMGLIIRSEPGNGAFIDTYANLLYKEGRTDEALAWEEKAIQLMPGQPEIEDNLSKMKRREPTWPTH